MACSTYRYLHIHTDVCMCVFKHVHKSFNFCMTSASCVLLLLLQMQPAISYARYTRTHTHIRRHPSIQIYIVTYIRTVYTPTYKTRAIFFALRKGQKRDGIQRRRRRVFISVICKSCYCCFCASNRTLGTH